MVLLCLFALYIEPKRPQLATCLALFGAWAETVGAAMTSSYGVRDPSSLAFIFLVVCCALLLGAGWAWAMTLTSCVLLPAALLLGRAYAGGPGIPQSDLDYLFVVEFVMIGVTILLTIFFQILAEVMADRTENAERWREFVEHAPDAIIALDRLGTVVAFNHLAEQYLRLDRSAVLGQSLDFLRRNHPLFFPNGQGPIKGPRILRFSDRTLEQRTRFRESSAYDTDWLYVIRDVTERELAAQNARTLENQLNHIQKMEAIGQLAGGVAHDFNNLLTAVSGAAYALRDAEKHETAEIADELLEASEHGASLTRQLLTFARREVVQAQVLDLGSAIESSEALITRVLGARIRFDLDAEPGCTVLLDEGQLKQVVLNFAANARDAIVGQGTFSLMVRRESSRVYLEASDTGIGMDPATMEHIFEPFFTTKSTTSGTGLGLATIHGIVTQWRGTIVVRSEIGQGTTFVISWPLSEEEVTGSTIVAGTSKRGFALGTVLLVEDNAPARRFIRRVLDRAGYHVTEASSAEDALALCHEGGRPHLVITDVIMPGLTGVDLATRLHQRWHHLPILFVSGYVDDVLADWPYDATRDLLLKPFSAEALLSRVEKKMEEGLGRRAPRPRITTQH